MGQYLVIGITTELSISKKEAEQAKLSLIEVEQKMAQLHHFDSNIYDFFDENGFWIWTIKKDIWEGELLDFLKVIYPLIYIDKKYIDYEEVLEKLNETVPNSWIELANLKSFTSFQSDKYGENERMYFDEKPFHPKIFVDIKSVALAMEGKIMMEVYGNFFNFFKICFQKAFPEFKISKAMRIYITG